MDGILEHDKLDVLREMSTGVNHVMALMDLVKPMENEGLKSSLPGAIVQGGRR